MADSTSGQAPDQATSNGPRSPSHSPPPSRWPDIPANTSPPVSFPLSATSPPPPTNTPASPPANTPIASPVNTPAPLVNTPISSPISPPLPSQRVAPNRSIPHVPVPPPATVPNLLVAVPPNPPPVASVAPLPPAVSNSSTTKEETFSEPSPPTSAINASITLETFRCLLGIPQDCPPLPRSPASRPSALKGGGFFAPIRRHTHKPQWLKIQSCHPEAATSTYFAILREENRTWRSYYFYDSFVYTALIVQLMISSVLIVLGALRGPYHIQIVALSAVSGVVCGILSLIKGQGLPIRQLQYAEQLRRVREDIEWSERLLRTGYEVVTYSDAIKLRQAYEVCRNDSVANHPDSWQGGFLPSVGGNSTNAVKLAPGAAHV